MLAVGFVAVDEVCALLVDDADYECVVVGEGEACSLGGDAGGGHIRFGARIVLAGGEF